MLINMEKQNTVSKIVFEVRWNSVHSSRLF